MFRDMANEWRSNLSYKVSLLKSAFREIKSHDWKHEQEFVREFVPNLKYRVNNGRSFLFHKLPLRVQYSVENAASRASDVSDILQRPRIRRKGLQRIAENLERMAHDVQQPPRPNIPPIGVSIRKPISGEAGKEMVISQSNTSVVTNTEYITIADSYGCFYEALIINRGNKKPMFEFYSGRKRKSIHTSLRWYHLQTKRQVKHILDAFSTLALYTEVNKTINPMRPLPTPGSKERGPLPFLTQRIPKH